ncbi:MAG: L-seryl-tRNA(Sec) selenium transferase [Proteobacteria bacterium]|nr:L-seryl-tRNA(Sec) selenium transferase [Pseudomonadota bacterium]
MNKFKDYLPKMDILLERAEKEGIDFPKEIVKRAITLMLDEQRESIKNGTFEEKEDLFSNVNFTDNLKKFIGKISSPKIKRVINATGTVIHTNLGRAPLSEKIIDEIKPLLCNYSDLEFDLVEGKRGSRLKHLKPDLFGAEDILVVNNNASACLLVLNTLAQGKEVIVSRGELVEIGGSFRVPEIMKASGAILKEVGTTNKTKPIDYERAINDNTGLILKVHRSNFVLKGFVEEVSTTQLVELSRRYNLPLYFDEGSGAISVIKNISNAEPIIDEEVKKGVDIISFSGDKLLGGTQAGIIVGRKDLIELMKKNPMYRALRPDKFTLYYLERLFSYLSISAYGYSPVLSMLLEPIEVITKRGKRLLKLLRSKIDKEFFQLTTDYSAPGGGSLPGVELKTCVLRIKHPLISEEDLVLRLLHSSPPIVARRKEQACIIDFRTVRDEEIPIIAKTLINIFNQ